MVTFHKYCEIKSVYVHEMDKRVNNLWFMFMKVKNVDITDDLCP